MNQRGAGMMIVYALITILVGFAIFTVLYNVYTTTIASGESMQRAGLCNLALSMEGGGTVERLAASLGQMSGYLPRSAGACSRKVVVNALPNRESTPGDVESAVVLAALAKEVDNCWTRSRVAEDLEFTCAHSFKFRLKAWDTVDECGLTRALCGPDVPEGTYPEWKANIRPGNTNSGCEFTCPGEDNVYGPPTISNTKISEYRIYYCGDNAECNGAVRIVLQ